MAFRVEPLSGGLVNARDAAMLSPGELSYIQNAVYVPGNQALVKARGRANYGIVSATASHDVVGLRDLKFDNGDHRLVALASSTLFTSVNLVGTASANTFATARALESVPTTLDTIHFDNEWYLFTGGDRLVGYVSATSSGQTTQFRQHGMAPVETALSNTVTSGTFNGSATGYYEYWVTEIGEYTRDGVTRSIESTFTGTPLTVFVSTTAMAITIDAPAIANPGFATKWRVWRSPRKDTQAEKQFPYGYAISPLMSFSGVNASGGDSSFTDGQSNTGTYVFVSATAANVGPWSNPTSVGADDSAFASTTFASGDFGSLNHVVKYVTYQNIFGAAPAYGAPIQGIEVEVEAKKTLSTDGVGHVGMSIALSSDGGVTYANPVIRQGQVPGQTQTVGTINAIEAASPATRVSVLGGLNNLWGRSWSVEDLRNGNFVLRLSAIASKVRPNALTDPTFTKVVNCAVDYIKIRIYHGGGITDGVLEEPFPAIIINQSGSESAVGSHGQPPLATVGDIFGGHLVTNSVSEVSHIKYSLPDQPDYFPSLYFIDFETPDNDRVTNIKTLNNRLGVFLGSRLYRVNYLPTEVDADFNRGRCKEEVSAELGCVNNMCACTFVGPGGRTELAFVSNVGIHRTDLFTVQDLTSDIDWRATFPVGSTAIALVNDPENAELLFYYSNSNGADTPEGANETYHCLHFNYDGAHIKSGGKLKVSGPVFVRNYDSSVTAYAEPKSVWPVTIANGNTYIYLGYGGDSANSSAAGAGTVWRESSSSILPVTDPRYLLRTRRMFEAGWGKEWRLDASYLYIPDGYETQTAQTLSMTPKIVRTNNATGEVAQTAATFDWNQHKLFKFQHLQEAEGMTLEIGQATGTTANIALQHVVLEGKGMGKEDSGI